MGQRIARIHWLVTLWPARTLSPVVRGLFHDLRRVTWNTSDLPSNLQRRQCNARECENECGSIAPHDFTYLLSVDIYTGPSCPTLNLADDDVAFAENKLLKIAGAVTPPAPSDTARSGRIQRAPLHRARPVRTRLSRQNAHQLPPQPQDRRVSVVERHRAQERRNVAEDVQSLPHSSSCSRHYCPFKADAINITSPSVSKPPSLGTTWNYLELCSRRPS